MIVLVYSDNYFFRLTTIKTFGVIGAVLPSFNSPIALDDN